VPRGVPVLPGVDAISPEVLRFSWTAPQATELAGPVTMKMTYACNEIDSYVIARLDRIDRRGARSCLAMGHLRPACRRKLPEWSSRNEIAIDIKAREPLTPDEPVTLEFSLTPAAALLAEGDTLELAIASRGDLLWLTVAEGFVLPDPPMPPYYAENTLTLGSGTVLEVAVRGT
jgi:predicted acyl esterase